MLSSAYNMSDFLSTIHTLDFLTLDDLSHHLHETHTKSKRIYEEAVEKLARQERDLRESKEKSKYNHSHHNNNEAL